MRVRASIGTLALLNIIKAEQVELPTTAYVLLHSDDGCMAECAFCPQSRVSRASKSLVSRVSWPEVDLELLVERIKYSSVLKRICIQSVIKDNSFDDLLRIITSLRDEGVAKPISVSTTPIDYSSLNQLKDVGVDALGIGFDAATPEVFKKVKKPYSWEEYIKFLNESIEVFGPKKVYVHLIYGLGESEVEFLKSIEYFKGLGVNISLFAFTPIKGTSYEHVVRPNILSYRKLQILKYLMDLGVDISNYYTVKGVKVIIDKSLVEEVINNLNHYCGGFITSGCPGCNRPFYNESVTGPHYNYPSRIFLQRNIEKLVGELRELFNERE
ncbi:MAG: radical SAM protein [Sulfolobales archaeon]|nr:radical SAM protein [Sulfolobales archaeon]MCX8186630.1 radical SAM protein [Sulfolobales archaeon]